MTRMEESLEVVVEVAVVVPSSSGVTRLQWLRTGSASRG